MDYQMDYPNGLSNGLPRWTTHMDYLINYTRKRKERNITPLLFVLIEFTDPPSCCFHVVFISAAQMVAGVKNGVDMATRLLRLVAFVHLPFSFRFRDGFCRFTLDYEGHFVLCCKEKLEPLIRSCFDKF